MVKRLRLPKGKKRGYTTTKRRAHGTRSHWKYSYSSWSESSSSTSSESSESI